MLHLAKTLKGYKLDSLDGEIGRVKEFYFDDQYWTIRYLVADPENWLLGRQVLISPYALETVDREAEHIGIRLTMEQIEDSPAITTDKPVSRQFEASYYGHYGWPVYWGGPNQWGTSAYPSLAHSRDQVRGSAQMGTTYDLATPPTVLPSPEVASLAAAAQGAGDPHLRSTRNVSGHHLQATDGELGHVEDFIIDDETWAIRYLVIDTRNWWPGKHVLLAPQWIERVSWPEKAVFVNLTRETIKQSPEYTADDLLNRAYETRLHDYYRRQGYWVSQQGAREPSKRKQMINA